MYMTERVTNSPCTIDRATAAVTPIGLLSGLSDPSTLAFDIGSGRMYLIDALYTVDPTSGAPTPVSSVGTSNLQGMVFIPGAGGDDHRDDLVGRAAGRLRARAPRGGATPWPAACRRLEPLAADRQGPDLAAPARASFAGKRSPFRGS